MTGRRRPIAGRPRGSNRNGDSIRIALREPLDVIRTPRVSDRRCGLVAIRCEQLEDRSVPSDLGLVSIPGLAASDLAATTASVDDVVRWITLAAEVAPSSSTSAPAPAVEGGAATATGSLLDAMTSDLSRVAASSVPGVPRIAVSLGPQTTGVYETDPGAADSLLAPSIDGLGLVSVSVGVAPVEQLVDDLGTGLVGTADNLLGMSSGGEADPTGGGAAADQGGGLSIGVGTSLLGTGLSTSISDSGVAVTIPGPLPKVDVPLPPVDSTGGATDPGQPPAPTNPAPPGGTAGIPTSPTNPILPNETGGTVALPTSGEDKDAPSPSIEGSGNTTPTAGSTRGDLIADDGRSTEVLVAAQSSSERTKGPGVGSASRGFSTPVTSSVSAVGLGDEPVAGEGGRQEAAILADPPPVRPEESASLAVSPEASESPAELVPGDLDGLEHAIGQLMRRFDALGEDLAEWLTQFGMLEILLAAGMTVVGCEIVRRRRGHGRLANPRSPHGSSSRPGPFYRPRPNSSARRGHGIPVGGPVTL